MTVNVLELRGCSPAPLAHYLKALGVMRLVAEQRDTEARGWWREDALCLATRLSADALFDFLLEAYSPSPVFNPWGGRSGYYSGSSESGARKLLSAIEASTHARFDQWRSTSQEVRSAVHRAGQAKPEGASAKAQLVRDLGRSVRGPGSQWLRTCVADLGEDVGQAPLTGTGGNEGSGSYTSGYMQAVVECLIERRWDTALRPALQGVGQRPQTNWSAGTFGQFVPEGTGSAWDLILAFEGALAIGSGIVRRAGDSGRGTGRFLASPFYMAPRATAYPSASSNDEYILNKGQRMAGRGEQWFPLWARPMRYCEVAALFADGRCMARRSIAAQPQQFARAVAGFGVARGLTAFMRYGYQQRNNLATHFAVPLGRVPVRAHPRVHLVDDLGQWLERLHRLAASKHAPARLTSVYRRVADACFAATTSDDRPDLWQAVLQAAADVEAVQAAGAGAEAGPIPRLSSDWVPAADDGSPEFRLAVTLALAHDPSRGGRAADSVRHHWLPLSPGATGFALKDRSLARDPRVVAFGRDTVTDCVALVARRLLEASQAGERRLPLSPGRHAGAEAQDLAALLAGAVDLDRCVRLARALMALRSRAGLEAKVQRPSAGGDLDDGWIAIRLALLPWPLDESRDIPADPAIHRRLASGDAPAAVEIALRRLRAAGLNPTIGASATSPDRARLWAAALAFPITRWTARRLTRRVAPALSKENVNAR